MDWLINEIVSFWNDITTPAMIKTWCALWIVLVLINYWKSTSVICCNRSRCIH